MAFTAADPTPKEAKDRKDAYADFEIVRREYTHSHIWTFDVAAALKDPQPGRPRTRGHEYTVGSFAWSPDGSKIAFSGPINPDLIQGGTADVFILNMADDTVKKIVSLPGPDSVLQWSPDGQAVLISSAMGNPSYFAANTRLALVPAEGGTPRSLTDAFDENPGFVGLDAGRHLFLRPRRRRRRISSSSIPRRWRSPASPGRTRSWADRSPSPATGRRWPSRPPRRRRCRRSAFRAWISPPAC